MELSRRKFISGAAIAGAGAMVAGLVGCSSGAAAGASDAPGADGVEHNPVSTESCDIVVVGTGTSGMCAATRAAELGASVIVLEKEDIVGGTSRNAEGIGGVNSYVHKRDGVTLDPDEVVRTAQDYHHWSADTTVLQKYIYESGATIDWLHECGIEFVEATVTAPTSYPTWHLPANAEGEKDSVAVCVIDPLKEYCESMGVEFKMSSPATGLIAEDGAVKGVYYSDGESEYAIECNAVILATGGYSCNQEMFEQFTTVPFDRIHNWGAEGRDGDGIRWAMELDADTHIPSTVMYAGSRIPDAPWHAEIPNWVFSYQHNPRINETGKRFLNETLSADFSRVANSFLAQGRIFSFMDQGYLDHIENEALPVGVPSYNYIQGEPFPGAIEAVEQAVSEGRIMKADTIDEIAEMMGVDADQLAETIEEYNGFAESGVDTALGAAAEDMFALTQPPYYAAELQVCMFTSVGGLRVNENMQVMRKDVTPIPGLYALGNDASSDTGRDYDVGIMSGSQQGWCATGGRIAAEHIMAQ